MRPIPILLKTSFDPEQVARIKAIHPALVVHLAPDGIPEEPATEPEAIETTLRQIEMIAAFRLPRNILQRAPRLKWIQYLGAGIEHLMPPRNELLPAEEFLSAGVILTTVSGIHAVPIAETALAMMLHLTKSWHVFEEKKCQHVWHREMQGELSGETLGIVALGHIGREIARLGRAMGMRVVAYDPYVAETDATQHVDAFFSQREQLATMLAMSDFVVCCAPFTRETYHMLGEAEFRAMKPGAYFINVGRGQLSGEAILIRALQEGWIAGAGLDAFEEEPLAAESPLWDMPNVVLIPHQSSNTGRYMARATEIVCENLRRYTAGEPLLNLVDPVRGF